MVGLEKEIYLAKHMEAYTPDGGQIYTQNAEVGARKRLKFAGFTVSEDANVTFETIGGDTVTSYPAKAGNPSFILVKKVTAVSVGTLYLLHDGVVENSGKDTAPTTQASSIQFSDVGDETITVSFTNGSGGSRILVARAGGAVNANPVDGTSYTGNLVFGEGDEIGTGNFVVGVGSGPFVVTGLTTSTTYHFRVYEFRGEADKEVYKTATATNNPNSQATS